MHDGHKWHDHKCARYVGSIESVIIHDPISDYTEIQIYVKCMQCNCKFRLYLLYILMLTFVNAKELENISLFKGLF